MAPASIKVGQTYAFYSWNDKRVIDLYGAQPAAKTAVIQYAAHMDASRNNQLWKVTESGDGSWVYLYSASATANVIDISGDDGKTVISYPLNKGDNQKWTFASVSQDNETPSWNIQSKQEGKCITATGNSNGQGLQGLSSGAGDSQRWIAVPVATN